MSLFRSLVVRVLCCVVVPVSVASGQGFTSPTFDLAAQAWKGRAGSYDFADDGGLALDVVAGWRAREFAYGAFVVGAAGAWQGHFMEASRRCVVACRDDFPTLSSLTALGGVEGTLGRSSRSASLRALAGPAVFFGESAGAVLGMEGRAVLSTPSLFHVALLFSARGAIIPKVDGRQHQMGALGVGIRVQ